MKRKYICMDNLRFLLYEVHGIEKLTTYPRFSHVGGREEIDLLLDAAKELADRELFPWFKEMDAQPVFHKDGKVHSHPQLKRIFKAVAEAGWFSATTPLHEGGLQLPYTVFSAAHLIFEAANNSAQGYLGVSTGALDLIATFGNELQKKIFMPPLMEGRWQGTMALTEPHAGSSLADIKTAAVASDEGLYEITGQKIFISAGEHEACENFVHMTLARIKGSPPGTKGISLFIVPKFIPASDGSLTYNHLECVADFQKMGQKGYATTHLVFGEKGPTKAWLVGEPDKGLSYMFQMMNAARIAVGQTAAAVASAAYYNALHYANERPQGRHITDKDPNKEQTLIINHADVRRLLLQQKCMVEGSLGLIIECLRLNDLCQVLEGDARQDAELLLELLTPIAKTYPSEEGIRSVSNALQVFGGYGFTMDFDAQQYYRDIRIMSIYEGTTGIQSLDLLARKVNLAGGRALLLLEAEIGKTCAQAARFDALKPAAEALMKSSVLFRQVLQHLRQMSSEGAMEASLADAALFLEMSSIILVGWQWLKQGICAQDRLTNGSVVQNQVSFYTSKIASMKFFLKYELPRTKALAETLMNPDPLTIKGNQEILI